MSWMTSTFNSGTQQRLQQAPIDELKCWAENLRNAQSLADVFGEP
ncbi:hypothetical protein [Halomonas cerina]|uniref:Uncharacterized protein n=1 Tax=Halomonas cerina TaxID=447424 RepID=A0A839VEJ7_9GAMM|nr:hypothetical protein [Halomonas cerina]MBB3192548.1 hypothetical protein [Halomonas cerina]